MAQWHNYSVKHACPATMIFYLYDHYRPTATYYYQSIVNWNQSPPPTEEDPPAEFA